MGWNSTLTRKTPLRAKKPMAPGKPLWRATKRPKGNPRPSKPLLRKTPLKKVSKAQRRRLSVYYPKQSAFLRENPVCGICLARDIMPPNAATEVHHLRGRAGKLIADTRFFVPSCRPCREWPHEHTIQARALGVLAEARDWGVCPPEEESSI